MKLILLGLVTGFSALWLASLLARGENLWPVVGEIFNVGAVWR